MASDVFSALTLVGLASIVGARAAGEADGAALGVGGAAADDVASAAWDVCGANVLDVLAALEVIGR